MKQNILLRKSLSKTAFVLLMVAIVQVSAKAQKVIPIQKNAIDHASRTEESIQVEDTVQTAVDYAEIAYDYAKAKDHFKAIEFYTKAIELNDKETNYLYNRALGYCYTDQFALAVQDLNDALELDPDNNQYLGERANAYSAMEFCEEAIADYEYVLLYGDNSTRIFHNYLTTLTECKQYEKAILKGEEYVSQLGEDGLSDEEFHSDIAFYIGLSYFQEKDLKNAVKWYSEAIRLSPDFSGYYSNRATAYSDQQQYTNAILDYNQAIELAPNDSMNFYNRGVNYYEMKAYSSALDDYLKAESLGNHSKELYLNLGNAYKAMGNSNKALVSFNKALAIDPKFSEAYNNKALLLGDKNKLKQEKANLQLAIKTGEQQSFKPYYNLGNKYYEAKNYTEAIKHYDSALALQTDFEEIYNNKGLSLYHLQRYQEAVDVYTDGISNSNNTENLYLNRSQAFKKLNELQASLSDLNMAIQLDPTNGLYFSARGEYYAVMDSTKKSIADYQKAIALGIRERSVFINLANAFSEEGQYKNALESANNAIETEPVSAESYAARANVYSDMEQYEPAIKDYSKALLLDAKNAVYLYNRGNIYLQQNKIRKAVADFESAVKYKPQFCQAYLNLGVAYGELKTEKTKSIDAYTRAIDCNPDMASAYFNRGGEKSQLKDYEGAIRDFDTSFELYEKNGPGRNEHSRNSAEEKPPKLSERMEQLRLRGYAEQVTHRWQDAIRDYEEFLKYSSDNQSTRNELGYCYLEMDNIVQAKKHFELAYKLDKNNVYNHIGLMIAEHLLSNEEKAKNHLKAIYKINPKLPKNFALVDYLEQTTDDTYTDKCKNILRLFLDAQ